MGQGKSEGSAPEDTTPEATQGSADTPAPASPTTPEPAEASTATRRIPVVPGEDDGEPVGDGDAEASAGETPAGDDDGEARGGDDPEAEAPQGEEPAGDDSGAALQGDPAAEPDARHGSEPTGDPAAKVGGGEDATEPTTAAAEGAAPTPVPAAGEDGSVDQPADPGSLTDSGPSPESGTAATEEHAPDAPSTPAGSADDSGASAGPISDAGATGGSADDPDAATDSSDDASSADSGAAVPAESDRPGSEPSVSEAAPTSPVPSSRTADAEPPATSTPSEAPAPRPEQDAASSGHETGSPRPEQDAAVSGQEPGTPQGDGSTESVAGSPAPSVTAASGAAADAAPTAPGRAPIASRLGADSTADSETAATRITARDEADDATTVLPAARDAAGQTAPATSATAATAITPVAAAGTASSAPGGGPSAPGGAVSSPAGAPSAPDGAVSTPGGAPSTPGTAPTAPAGASSAPGTAPTATGDAPAAAREEGSPLDVFDEEPAGKRRWWRPVLIVAGVLVVLGGAYVGGAYALADRVPRGTTVAGIEVGGMSAEDARTALTEGLAERSSQPITVTAREVSGTVDPATAGLTFDVEATVDSLTGIDLRPQRMWQHLAGGGAESPVTEVDDGLLDAAIEDLSGSLTLAPVDGSVVFVDGQPQGVAAVDGWSLDTEGARSTLEDGWLTEALPIELPSDTVTPAITQDEVDRVVRDVASAVVSGPVTVSVAGQNAELPVDVVTAAASFVPQESELVLQIDGAALVEQVVSRTTDLLTTAADAKFEFQDGAPVIVPGTPGTTLDPAALATAVATAASSTSERTATVELVESDPEQSTQALEELGVKEAISEFSTPLTSEPRRTQNIAAGAAAINGTLIRPGETFSLTEALGPIDAAHGFVQAGAIVNGEHSDAWGGGLSQLSTTTFNAAFEAGMEDVEHTPHSEWFQRYPAGREATLYTGSIDMKWKNTSPYGVLVQAYVADGKTWVRLWSTHHFDVEITSGAKTNVVSPTTVYNTSPTCSPQSAGNPGFSISVTRNVLLNGQVQSTDNLSWRYKPQNRVVCGADPASQPAAG